MAKSQQISDLPKGKRGPKTEEGKARSLANLRPFKPGEVANPAGRPSAGAAVKEWFNQMTGWTLEQLQAVINDPQAPAAKGTAAKQWMNALEGNGASVDRIFDRTEGLPEQPVKHGGSVEIRNCTTDELRTIRDILALASRRAGQPAPAGQPGRN